MPLNKIILLLGPTGVGKTDVAIELARLLKTEIISADSMQIYKGMDIGTGKASPEQLSAVKHHMIDIIEPGDTFSAGRYIEAVKPIIERLHAKGKIPLITGGTGLYVKAMTRGLFEGPSADDVLRESLKAQDVLILHERLKSKDPDAAGRIKPNDKRRIIRALEVIEKSGVSMTRMQSTKTLPLKYDYIKIALTRERKELYGMIDRRVDDMMDRGLISEVKSVLRRGPGVTAMQAIGYKEMAAHLNGECGIDEAVRIIKRNTRRYAKRQFTWFNAEPDMNWIELTGIEGPSKAVELIRPLLKARGIEFGR